MEEAMTLVLVAATDRQVTWHVLARKVKRAARRLWRGLWAAVDSWGPR